MIGASYWATGITVTHHPENWGGSSSAREPREWAAYVDYLDDGFCDWHSTEGRLRTRYGTPSLTEAIDLVKTDADRLGIVWKEPTLYVEGDGEDPEVSLPEGWRDLLAAECDRLGWRQYSDDEIAPTVGSEARPGATGSADPGRAPSDV